MGDTKIKWAKKVWNPFGGCKKVSTGCKNCYAVRLGDGRLRSFYPDGFENGVYFFRHRLDEPRKWRKPQIVFVGSMGDIYQPNMPDSYIDEIYKVVADLPQHTFMMLTKYPDRMHAYLSARYKENPLPNVWAGVSVENQEAANKRIPLLLDSPASKRFVSYGPALGPIEFTNVEYRVDADLTGPESFYKMNSLLQMQGNAVLDLVIMEGESGPNARPMNPSWVRFALYQCRQAGTSFFFKQWGEWCSYEVAALALSHDQILAAETVATDSGGRLYRIGKDLTGDLLDGVQYREWPESLGASSGIGELFPSR